jgi:hypothetical protein
MEGRRELVRDGRHCPRCGRDVGIWAVMSAALPTRVWCPGCGARLSYRGAWLLFAVALPLLLALAVGAAYVALLLRPEYRMQAAALFGVLVLGSWGIVEWLLALYLRRYHVLTEADPAPQDHSGR